MSKPHFAVILVLAVLGGAATFVSASIGVQPVHVNAHAGGRDGEMPAPGLYQSMQ